MMGSLGSFNDASHKNRRKVLMSKVSDLFSHLLLSPRPSAPKRFSMRVSDKKRDAGDGDGDVRNTPYP
jgi:hypothetical protein